MAITTFRKAVEKLLGRLLTNDEADIVRDCWRDRWRVPETAKLIAKWSK